MDGFEWDPAKAAANLAKHHVDFADAALSLEDPRARTVPDPDSTAEEPQGTVLVTVYAYVAENRRIISSRKASPSERKRYEKP